MERKREADSLLKTNEDLQKGKSFLGLNTFNNHKLFLQLDQQYSMHYTHIRYLPKRGISCKNCMEYTHRWSVKFIRETLHPALVAVDNLLIFASQIPIASNFQWSLCLFSRESTFSFQLQRSFTLVIHTYKYSNVIIWSFAQIKQCNTRSLFDFFSVHMIDSQCHCPFDQQN